MTTKPTVQYEDHWRTWSINAGYYGVSYDTDRDLTAYSSEWHKTEREARAVAKRHAAIVAGIQAHGQADAKGNRRYRLRITVNQDRTLTVGEYDFNRFTFTIEAAS